MATNPDDLLSNQEYYQNVQQAIYHQLRQMGLDPTRNYLARRLQDQWQTMQTLRDLSNFTSGITSGNFGDFVRQYLSGRLGMGGGVDVRGMVNQAMAAGPGSTTAAWLTEGDPEEQFQRLAALQGLTMQGMTPAYQRAFFRVQEPQFRDWWSQLLSNPIGAPQSWLERLTGRNFPAPAQAAASQPQGAPTYQPAPITNVLPTGPTGGGTVTAPGAPSRTAPPPPVPTPAHPFVATGQTGAPSPYTDFQAALRAMGPGGLWSRGQQGVTSPFNVGGYTYTPKANTRWEWWGKNKADEQTQRQGHSALQRVMQWVDRYYRAQRGEIPQNLPNDWSFEQIFQWAVRKLQEQYQRRGIDWSKSGFSGE